VETGRAILERAVHIPDVEGDPKYLNQALTQGFCDLDDEMATPVAGGIPSGWR